MSSSSIKKEIYDKKIVIFGCGGLADLFWEKHHERLNICFFTSNNKEEIYFHDLERIEPYGLLGIDNIYIVICAGENAISSIENQLSMSFRFYEDYISCNLFEELILDKKKLILIIGLCQQVLVERGLKSIASIKRKYAIQHYWHAIIAANTLLRRHVENLSQYAQFTIVLNAEKNQKYSYISEKTILIKMPYLLMDAMFPQIVWGAYLGNPKILHMGDVYLESPIMLKKEERPISDIRAFRYTDQNVVKMLKQGMGENEILREISNENFYDKSYLDTLIEKMKQYNKNIDNVSDIHMADYIMDNFKKKKLFLDGVHFSEFFIWQIIKEILKEIHEEVEWNQIEEKNLLYELSKENAVWENECPIYPSVWKNLGIEWVNEKTEYTMVKFHKTEKVSFDEYMINYINYTKCVLEIKKIW